MKLVSFEHEGQVRPGVLLEGKVADVTAVDAAAPRDMVELLRRQEGIEWLDRASKNAPQIDLRDVQLRSPVIRPGKIVCVGQNYADHCREQKIAPPDRPVLFAKFPTAVIGPEEPIRLNGLSDQVDYEAELALVIGRKCYRVSEEDALDYVAGYTCLNDVSARDLQFSDGQWTRAKSMDSFCPVGPWLVTRDEILDPQRLRIRCRVNSETMQDSSTSEMIFGCAHLIAYISQGITLEPGDLVSTGTPDGVGVYRHPRRFLKDGDRVTISIEGVGDLVNPVSVV